MENYVPVHLAYIEEEPISGSDETLCPVIFLHSFTDTKELWHDIPSTVADRTKRRTFCYDMRNHGDSEWTDEFKPEDLVNDLYYFMDLREIPKAILVAHSLGGYAASQFAVKWPEKVEMIILEDMVIGKIPNETKNSNLGFVQLWAEAVRNAPPILCKADAIKYAVDYFYDQIPSNQRESLGDKESRYACDYNLKQNDDGSYEIKVNIPAIVRMTRDTNEGYGTDMEGKYDGPAYFITGGLSMFKIKEKEKEKICKHFPKAEFFTIESATHNVHIDSPEQYKKILLACILKNQKHID